MIVPDEVLARGFAVASRWQMKCSVCHNAVPFDHLQYVNLDGWPEFQELLFQREVGRVVCGCPSQHMFPSPLVIEIPRRNILIYSTHGGDNENVEENFKRDVARLKDLARERPYTFVHGWNGLEAILTIFSGGNARQPARPFPHSVEDQPEISTIFGYTYGELFFYEPAHLAVQPTAHALLEFSSTLTEVDDIDRMIRILLSFTSIFGPIHPWIVQELGVLNFRAGRYDEAEAWLTTAQELGHRWLAVTRSFSDATPTRRADADPQDESLPHARPASALGDITDSRHIVVRQRPAVEDYGLWHFPSLQQAVIPPVYTPQHILAGQGLVHGGLAKAVRDDKWLRRPGTGDLPILEIRMQGLLEHLRDRQELAEYRRTYFQAYVLGRWQFSFGAFHEADPSEPGTRLAQAKRILRHITEASEKSDLNSYFVSECAEELRTWFGRLDS